MTDISSDDLVTVVDILGREFATADSSADISQTAVDTATLVVDSDVAILAEKQDEGLTQIASRPTDWTDTDGLLSPTSEPNVIAAHGTSHRITDRSDVRGATAAHSGPQIPGIDLRSVLVVPVGDDRVLIAGTHSAGAFSETDLERLRLLGRYATSRLSAIESGQSQTQDREWIAKAAAGLSHDAENFLGVIEGRAAIARDDPQSDHFTAIEQAASRLRELITDTRILMESGTYIADPETVPLREVVRAAWAVEQTESAQIDVQPLQTVRADRTRLSRLLENLFRNAVEHAGPDVTVRVGMLSDAAGFYVEDDGPGIDPEERDSVLQFAYSTSADHTGLGLTIVQWIAAAHGWNISITESPLGGTRFEFNDVEISE